MYTSQKLCGEECCRISVVDMCHFRTCFFWKESDILYKTNMVMLHTNMVVFTNMVMLIQIW